MPKVAWKCQSVQMIFSMRIRNKYHNTKIVNEFGTWDSKKEFKRWLILKEAETQGLISELKRQVKFELIPPIKEIKVIRLKTKEKTTEKTVQRAIEYIADFVYMKGDTMVVEDIKASSKRGAIDKVFLIKEKLFRYRYGFNIKRVYRENDEI